MEKRSCILDLRKFSGYGWTNPHPWKPLEKPKPETPDKKVITLKTRYIEPEVA